jgi:hypothetical protein
MLPVEKAKGQIWLHDKFLCDVEYDISKPLKRTDGPQVQRVTLVVPEEHCAVLLDSYDLTLVLADGQRFRIPRPLQHLGSNRIECYVESSP